MKQMTTSPQDLGQLAGMMRKVDFFSPLTVGQLEQVLPQVRLYSFNAGETVFREGQPGDAFYIVYKGSVDVRLKRMVLFHKSVATLKEGDFFGEIALVSSEPRTATVVCNEDCLLFALIASDFQYVLRENPAAFGEMKKIADRRKFDTSHSD